MLKELLNDHQLFNSDYQDDNFVTRSGGTPWGQYKQAIRELYKRFRGLRESTCDLEKLEIEIEEKAHSAKYDEGFKRKYAEIEHKRKTMQKEELERTIKDTKREFKRFYQQAMVLKKQIGEVDDKRRYKLDEEMHVYKAKEMFIFDMNTMGKYSHQTYEFIMSFPHDTRIELMEQLKNEKLIKNYEHRSDDFKELPEVQVECLLED